MSDKHFDFCELEEKGKYEKIKRRLQFTREEIIPRIGKIDSIKAKDMFSCGRFVWTLKCTKCGSKHLAGLNRCRSRFCIECAHQRAMTYLGRFYQRFLGEVGKGYHITHMVLTIRDGPDLKERLETIKSAWRRINGDKEYRRKFKSRFIGGLRTIEVKIGKYSGEWHPHFHALVVTPKEFEKDYDWFQPMWKKLTKGNGSVYLDGVDLRGDKLFKSILEAVKYIVSPSKMVLGDLDEERFYELYMNLRGLRAVNTWGILRGIVEKAEEEAFAGEDIEEKMLDFICQACGYEKAELKVYLAKTLENEKVFDL